MMGRAASVAILLLTAIPAHAAEGLAADKVPCPPGQSCAAGQELKVRPPDQAAAQTPQETRDEMCEPARWSGIATGFKQDESPK
ncbi:MAG: hypothetical protein KDJ73_03200 [Notoacmeibacter sp.]|nr:hypothetical protein [Notoacmeibacter sp.]MCC0031812.1 hypothetical protein [Brucellaceae bacterium]